MNIVILSHSFHKELDCHAIRRLNNGHSCDIRFNIARAAAVKVAPYSYLKFWVFYTTFGLAKFTTNTRKTSHSDYFDDTHNVLNYVHMCEKYHTVYMLICSKHFYKQYFQSIDIDIFLQGIFLKLVLKIY